MCCLLWYLSLMKERYTVLIRERCLPLQLNDARRYQKCDERFLSCDLSSRATCTQCSQIVDEFTLSIPTSLEPQNENSMITTVCDVTASGYAENVRRRTIRTCNFSSSSPRSAIWRFEMISVNFCLQNSTSWQKFWNFEIFNVYDSGIIINGLWVCS